MSDLTVRAQAMVCGNPSEFHQKKTTFFFFQRQADVPVRKLIEGRYGMKDAWKKPRAQYIDATQITSRIAGSNRADLVVSDTPHELYAFIDKQFVMKTFKLDQVQERAQDLLGKTLTMWSSFFDLDRDERSKVLGQLVMRECTRLRRTEEQLLGITRLSWEEFGRDYKTIADDRYVYAFPTGRHDAYTFSSGTSMDNHSGGLIFGDHEGNGNEKVWILNYRLLSNFFNPKSEEKPVIKAADDWFGMTDHIDEIVSMSNHISVGYPNVNLDQAPFLFDKVMKVGQIFNQANFDMPTLTQLARDLNVRGYSNKTKAELSIMIGEQVANLPPTELDPALVIEGYNNNIFENHDEVLAKAGKSTAKDYFTFFSRMVSGVAYSPHLPAHAAGRIPTDGSFSSLTTYRPIDIFGELEVSK